MCIFGSGEADCSITMTGDDFCLLCENPRVNGMTLFFQGRMKVAGNQMLVARMDRLFSLR